jgi:hypothetical protein
MDVDSRKNEEKGASKKVDIEIEVRRGMDWPCDQRSTFHASLLVGFAKQVSGEFVRPAI